jgi:Do/DeqQ family serine protease
MFESQSWVCYPASETRPDEDPTKMRLIRLLLPALIALAACSGRPGDTHAQALQGGFPPPERRAPADAASMRLSFAPVVRKAAPAVVNVFSRRVVRQRVDPFWQMFGVQPRQGVEQSLGSGAIVRGDGIIVTNHHVVEGGQEIEVVLNDRRQFPARILLDDPRTDLAVLKIEPKGERLPVLPMDATGDLQVGDLVLAIGNPFGVGQTVTNGIISALQRTQVGAADYSNYIQTDAPINPGNSGGPLVDMNGDLIGINTFILSGSGSSAGVGFAIPAALVRQVVEAAVGGGHAVVRPWLGIHGQEMTGELASSLGLERPDGVVVTDVYPGSAADRAGIHARDVILSVDGAAVNDEAAVEYRFATHRPGDQVPLQLRSGRQLRTVTVRAEAPPASPARDERTIAGRNPLSGATVVNLSPAVAQELGVDPFAASKGVMVTKLSEGALAGNVGLRPGDVIVGINDRPVRSTGELQAALGSGDRSWRVTIQRGGQQITGDFRL